MLERKKHVGGLVHKPLLGFLQKLVARRKGTPEAPAHGTADSLQYVTGLPQSPSRL